MARALTGGENVLVLGATGAVGLVAVQAAKLLGAARVVAAGRSAEGLERATELGADGTVRLDVDDLASAFRDAFGGSGPSYVFDPVWGAPLAAAVQAATPRATIVNLGQSAGATAELASGPIRFKNLSLLGHTNFAVPEDELTEHYHRLVGHVAAGEIVFDVERVPLDAVASAWQRQADGTGGTKLVLVPWTPTRRCPGRVTDDALSARGRRTRRRRLRPIARGPTASRGCPRPSGRSPAQQRGRTRRPAPARPRPSAR